MTQRIVCRPELSFGSSAGQDRAKANHSDLRRDAIPGPCQTANIVERAEASRCYRIFDATITNSTKDSAQSPCFAFTSDSGQFCLRFFFHSIVFECALFHYQGENDGSWP